VAASKLLGFDRCDGQYLFFRAPTIRDPFFEHTSNLCPSSLPYAGFFCKAILDARGVRSEFKLRHTVAKFFYLRKAVNMKLFNVCKRPKNAALNASCLEATQQQPSQHRY
jgi:hypothetical protein